MVRSKVNEENRCDKQTRPGITSPEYLDGTVRHRLRENLRNDIPFDIGQTKIAALESVRQPGVFQTEQMQNRGLNVVDVNSVFHRGKTKFIGDAVDDPRSGAAAGHPHR